MLQASCSGGATNAATESAKRGRTDIGFGAGMRLMTDYSLLVIRALSARHTVTRSEATHRDRRIHT